MARTKSTAAGDGAASPAPAREGAATPRAEEAGGYTVVARRYRPQRFEDVVGQDHVVQALRNAIRLNRVTHAYVFSGTRGVGKTSMARIFAKALNCVHGPTETPCNRCEVCRDISDGQDVDVIEIDGASNNGVESVRELRQNAGLRPSRARFKIYYIDEVHMLSTGAFNALLKTLEEPPEHVKFLFATTEPNKIPITVLSRCQRFDFAGIAPEQIIESLAGICAQEGIDADREALQAVARRAGGSMRDAQSLLEQLLSFGGKRLTSELVHRALGIAPDDRVLDLIDALADRDAGRALALLDGSVASGIQPVDLLNGVLEFLRDVMVVAAGAEVDTLAAAPGQRTRLREVAGRWGLDAVLAAMQILAEARGRLRGSPHGRLLVELALCRVARLEDFTEVNELIGRLAALDGGAPAPPPKKKLSPAAREPATPSAPPSGPPPAPSAEPRGADSAPIAGPPAGVAADRTPDLGAAGAAWESLPDRIGAPLNVGLRLVRPAAIEPPGILVVPLPRSYNWIGERLGDPEALARIEGELRALLGAPVSVRFEPAAPAPGDEPAAPAPTRAERADDLAADPFVLQVSELFEARRVRVEFEEDRGGEPAT